MATKTARLTRGITINGMQFTQNKVPEGGRDTGIIVTANAAKAGSLTVRTDANTGTVVTSASGHGIVDSDRVSLFWTDGSRHGLTVGTVSGTSIPVDGGAGDDLPSASTVLTICKDVEKEFVFDAVDVEAFGIKAAAQSRAHVTFAIADNTEKFAKHLEAGQVIAWADGDDTSPISTGAITKVFVSQASATAGYDVQIGVLLT